MFKVKQVSNSFWVFCWRIRIILLKYLEKCFFKFLSLLKSFGNLSWRYNSIKQCKLSVSFFLFLPKIFWLYHKLISWTESIPNFLDKAS